MKIKPEHYAHMRDAMREAQAKKPQLNRAHYAEHHIGKDTDKRHRWDLLYAAIGSKWICDNLCPYCNDDHIDTALRAIVRELESCASSILKPTST